MGPEWTSSETELRVLKRKCGWSCIFNACNWVVAKRASSCEARGRFAVVSDRVVADQDDEVVQHAEIQGADGRFL